MTDFTPEATIIANGIQIAYDSFGDPAAPPVLLIMGLGAQLISWDEEFCAQLAAHGFRVIRFDNRDVGHSTRFDQAGVPNLLDLLQAWQGGGESLRIKAAYTLEDMASDAIALLDVLGIEATHIMGMSLGGMIAQIMAVRAPLRVRTLTALMSATGDLGKWSPSLEAISMMVQPPPMDRDGYIEHSAQVGRFLNGPGFAFDEARSRARAARNYDRGVNPAGSARQLAAALISFGWEEELDRVRAPTLVVHGEADPLIPAEGGRDVARRIPGARLLTIPGLGHALLPAIWPLIIDGFVDLAGALPTSGNDHADRQRRKPHPG